VPGWFAAQDSNLCRNVDWLNAGAPLDSRDLQAPVPALLQSQAYVVDLTEAYDQLAGLVPWAAEKPAASVPEPKQEQRTLGFSPVTAEVAADLLMDQAELQKIAELLWERKQVIFYGPPGSLGDADAAIGPSYLMRTSIYHRPDGLERVWQYEIMPLLEDLFYGQADLRDKYGLESLRRVIEPS
jgi:hypothetical protein